MCIRDRFNLALDSLALYTNAGFKASMTVTLCMLALALAELRRMKNRLRDELEQLLADNAFTPQIRCV